MPFIMPPEFPWSFATCFGEDEYGLFQEFTYKNVTQRMRWIQPGTFMMGSPESEPEREKYGSDETQHKVTLTKGFWLADTACTQELWVAVMGKIPSRFKDSPQNPVENVSWDDCQEFLAKINTDRPELALCLPTEAQWEYACRAGTITPFNFGDNITIDQVNFNGDFPYNKGKKGEYREKTVPVKSLPINPWGLYEMHGNTWEWCEDWFGDYEVKNVITPFKQQGTEYRVLRGGSWKSFGWHCRSAHRFRFTPGFRDDLYSFRFACGNQELYNVKKR